MGKRKNADSVACKEDSQNGHTNNNDVDVDANERKESFSDKSVDFDAEMEFKKLYNHALKMGLTPSDLSRLTILQDIEWNGSCTKMILKYSLVILVVFLVLYVGLFVTLLMDWPISRQQIAQYWMELNNHDIEYENCLVNMPEFVSDVFRPPVECDFCKGVKEVKTVYNITQDEFEKLYAYTGVPVIVGDGTANWTAPAYFCFDFFKEIYHEGSQALLNHERKCQFFPYKTSFQTLGDVLNMSPERAKMEDGSEPWYIGWSNCDFTAANILRKHYKRPYFLPKLSESSKTDWMFMGSPGYGAHMHIDHVGSPSWQAQITGTKKWTLEPPPECYYICPDRLEVIVHPGEIIVLDTDIWYHSTLNVGDDISITIGSEYD
ncbi:hypothetical protein ACF0H5_006241 [Mactra antiquata]